MKNPINNIYISLAEYSYILELSPIDKFKYLTDRFEQELDRNLDLSDFFNSIHDNQSGSVDEAGELNFADEPDPDRVDVLIDDDHIMIESNSLIATRIIIKNFFESGYLLQRDKDIEKMFRTSKVTKYLRVYTIVGIHNIMSLN